MTSPGRHERIRDGVLNAMADRMYNPELAPEVLDAALDWLDVHRMDVLEAWGWTDSLEDLIAVLRGERDDRDS